MTKTAPYYTQALEKDGDIVLPDAIFSIDWNPDLVYQVVTAIRANERSGTASTKDRSMKRGGGKKPWRQKGTGKARHGSRRSPIWRGGGVTFGPSIEKIYTKQINKKMRAKALGALLTRLNEENRLLFTHEMNMEIPKTKDAVVFLDKAFSILPEEKQKALIVVATSTPTVRKSFSNISDIDIVPVDRLNANIVSKYLQIIFTGAPECISGIEKRFT